MIIRNLAINEYAETVSIFTEAFANDPLFVFAFTAKETRTLQTRIMYEFVVNDMVPGFKLDLVGAYVGDVLAGCMIFTTPESLSWNEEMNKSVERMRERSGEENMRLIGEYATLGGFDPDVPHFYGNELAVRKEFRRRGIGKALCQYLIDQCMKSDLAEGIVIDTANESNLELYKKLGWELKRTVSFYRINKYFLWREKDLNFDLNFMIAKKI